MRSFEIAQPTSSGSRIEVPSALNIELMKKAVTSVHRRIIERWYNFGPYETPEELVDDILERIATLGATAMFPVAILFLGLIYADDNDPFLPSHPAGRFPFAFSALVVNGAQIYSASKETLRINLHHYVKPLILAFIGGRTGIQSLINDLMNNKIKSLKSVVRSGLTWYIAYQASIIQRSLAQQVSWLQSESVLNWVHVASTCVYFLAIIARISAWQWPRLTANTIVAQEIGNLRELVAQILKFNREIALNHLANESGNRSQILFDAIKGAENTMLDKSKTQLQRNKAFDKLLSKVLIARELHVGEFSYPTRSVIALVTPGILLLLSIMSNAGGYTQTLYNTTQSVLSRYSSVIVDILLDTFIAISSGEILAGLYGSFTTILFTRPHRVLAAFLGLVFSAFNFGSSATPNSEAGVPTPIIVCGIAGVVLNSLYFLTELITEFLDSRQLRADADSKRYKIAVLESFYTALQNHLEQLPDEDFAQSLLNLLRHDRFLEHYERYFKERLPWAKGLSLETMLETLTKPPEEALKTINRSGRFGRGRTLCELGGNFVAMVCALSLIPLNSAAAYFFLRYVVPPLSIPIGVAVTFIPELFNRNSAQPEERQALNIKQQPLNEADNAATHSRVYYLLKCGAGMALSFATTVLAPSLFQWVGENVFQQSPEGAELTSQLGTALATMVVAGLSTNNISVSLR